MLTLVAIADPTRRAILELIARQGATPSGIISAEFPMTASAISQHLKVLVAASWLIRETHGQQRLYRINPDGFDEVAKWLERTRWFWQQSKTS